MKINGVTIQMLPAASGDCIYLEFPDSDFRMLIDGGYAKTYQKYLKKFLLKLAAEGKRLNLIVVTHIDDDHISGIRALLKENGDSRNPKIIEIDEIWFNSLNQCITSRNAEQGMSFAVKIILKSMCSTDIDFECEYKKQNISYTNGKNLAELIQAGGYRWNASVVNNLVSKGQIVQFGDLKITILNPGIETLTKMGKKWLYHLKQISSNNIEITRDPLFDAAFEGFLLNNEKNIEFKQENISYSSEDLNWLDKYAEYKDIEMDSKITNCSSIALLIDYKDIKMLFPGDSPIQLFENELPEILDIIKLPHHGSAKNISLEFIKNTRYKKSCLPLDKNIKNNLYKIWDTLNSHSDWKEKNKNKWFTVGLYLLENYRQNMDEEKWNSICDLLKPCTNFIVDGKYYLKLEEILMNLFKMDLEKVQLELVSCSLEEMPYEVRLRFIGVMTECGLNEEALKAVEELTNDIQKNNNEIAESSPQNVYLKSLLVCALYLKEHLLFCMNPYKEETRKKCNEINNEISKYKKYYNWDKEKILFTDGALTWLKKESPEPEFELNRESITLVRSENNCWEAYSVFKSIEYSGFPLYLRSKSLLNNQQDILVKSLLSYYPQYTWQLLLRLGKADVVKKCITREYLQSKNRKEIDELFEYVYNAIMNNIGKFQKYDPWYDQNIYTSIVASGIPILERMCAVLDYVQQGKMIDLMIRLIEENAVKDQRLLNQFISSVMNQTADYIKRTKINALLTCSMKKRENILGVVQLDPFDVFTEYELSNPLYRKAHLEPKIIKAIFNIGKQQKINRTSVLARMGQLYTWGKLTKEQEVAFGELLWSKLNEDTQLPDLEQYYFFVFMKWPHPEEIDPLKRIKKSFISEKVSSKWKEDIRGRNFTEISYWEQLAVWNRYYVDEWSAKEKKWFLELFIGCCSDMVKYWKESKYDFQFTFSKWHMKMMIRAIASFGRNGWKGTNPVQSKKLCTLLKEFYDEGIYSWEVEAMFLADEKVPAFMNEMLELMYETESDMVFSATMAVEKCLETIMDQQLKENTLLELFNLIKARKEPGLEYFLMIIHNIFYRTNSRFPSKIMKGVSQVLRLVEKYTRINFQTSTQEEFKENIKVRKQCATLAFLIYRFENTFYEGQHCPEVEEWKNICTGEKAENEFAEVKNCWLLPEL